MKLGDVTSWWTDISVWIQGFVHGTDPSVLTSLGAGSVVLAGVAIGDTRMITDAAILGMIMWSFESRFTRHEATERADKEAIVTRVTTLFDTRVKEVVAPVERATMIFSGHSAEYETLTGEVRKMRTELATVQADMTAGFTRVGGEIERLKGRTR